MDVSVVSVVTIAITVMTTIAVMVAMVITLISVIPLVVSAAMIVISAIPFSIIPVRAAACQQERAGNGQDHHYCAIHLHVLQVRGMRRLAARKFHLDSV